MVPRRRQLDLAPKSFRQSFFRPTTYHSRARAFFERQETVALRGCKCVRQHRAKVAGRFLRRGRGGKAASKKAVREEGRGRWQRRLGGDNERAAGGC